MIRQAQPVEVGDRPKRLQHLTLDRVDRGIRPPHALLRGDPKSWLISPSAAQRRARIVRSSGSGHRLSNYGRDAGTSGVADVEGVLAAGAPLGIDVPAKHELTKQHKSLARYLARYTLYLKGILTTACRIAS